MTSEHKIAFLGAGNMAGALIGGLTKGAEGRPGSRRAPPRVWATDPRAERRQELQAAHGIRVGDQNAEAAAWADVVVLAVKPQVLDVVLGDIGGVLTKDHLVVSVAAGVGLGTLEAKMDPARVIRAMPNTPALVGAGVTAFARGTKATDADADVARDLFEQVGATLEIGEEHLDAVTGLSGSGPAYVFRLAEGLVAGGVAAGLTSDEATFLAVRTLVGAAQLLAESGDSPARLREMVTSPRGTTSTGLAHLDAGGFHDLAKGAVEAAADRSRELGAEISAKLQDLSETDPRLI